MTLLINKGFNYYHCLKNCFHDSKSCLNMSRTYFSTPIIHPFDRRDSVLHQKTMWKKKSKKKKKGKWKGLEDYSNLIVSFLYI